MVVHALDQFPVFLPVLRNNCYFLVLCLKLIKTRLPSAYILQDPSFSPAPQTPRSVKAVDVIDSFMKIFGGQKYFSVYLCLLMFIFCTHKVVLC